MSWWDTGNKDDVIGDEGADRARHAFGEIAETRAQQGQEKPRLADVLRAIGTVAIGARGTLLEAVPPTLREIVAELKTGQTVSSGVLRGPAEENDLVRILNKSLSEIAAVYSERWERNPRLTEWLETLAFVLRSRSEKFLEDGAEHPPEELRPITG